MSRKNSRARRARAAFDADALARICVMPEDDFAGAYEMKTVHLDQYPPHDFYHFRDNGSDILAVAHLDTVSPAAERKARFVDTQAGPVVFSRALDDRLGAYIILDMMPKLGVKFDVLLTTGEETGRSTASFFEQQKDYNWMIEFDRGGTDVVMYDYENREARAAVMASGAVVGDGIFSDICYLDHLGVKGFNWGVGYRDYHGPRSHAFLNDTFVLAGQFLKFHEMFAGVTMPHAPEPRYESGLYSTRDCILCESKRTVDPITRFCSMCGSCQDCAETEGTCQCYTPSLHKSA